MTPATAALLLKGIDLGIFMMQFSAERQRLMRERIAALPAELTPAQIDAVIEEISLQALNEAQAAINRARELLPKKKTT
jgi:hypothetical protein